MSPFCRAAVAVGCSEVNVRIPPPDHRFMKRTLYTWAQSEESIDEVYMLQQGAHQYRLSTVGNTGSKLLLEPTKHIT